MKIMKRILGVAILTHIIPAICVITTIAKHEVAEYGYLIPYIAGWFMNVCILAMVGVIKLVTWCFDL